MNSKIKISKKLKNKINKNLLADELSKAGAFIKWSPHNVNGQDCWLMTASVKEIELTLIYNFLGQIIPNTLTMKKTINQAPIEHPFISK